MEKLKEISKHLAQRDGYCERVCLLELRNRFYFINAQKNRIDFIIG